MQQLQQQQMMEQQQMMAMQQQPMAEGAPMTDAQAIQEAKIAMAQQSEMQNRFADQFNPAMGGIPPIVGKGALPAQTPGQKPVSGEGDFMTAQEGEM